MCCVKTTDVKNLEWKETQKDSRLCHKVCMWFLSLCNTMPLSDKQKSHMLLSYNLQFKINEILRLNSFTVMGQRPALLSDGKRDPVLAELCPLAITALPASSLLSIIFISTPSVTYFISGKHQCVSVIGCIPMPRGYG